MPLNFTFEFVAIEMSETITIDPMKGVIPANSYIDIEVCFVSKIINLADGGGTITHGGSAHQGGVSIVGISSSIFG